jgi:hypothetical protein
MSTLKKHAKLLIASAMMIAVILLVTVVILPLILNYAKTEAQYYDLDQEIRGLPTENASITFTSWNYTSSSNIFGAEENSNLIVLNFTFRNIADKEIDVRPNLQYYTGADSFTPREAPLLRYDDNYSEAINDIPYARYWRLWEPKTSLLPNESVKGYLVYAILEGYAPTELVYPSKDSPQIIIKLQQ